MWSDRRLWGLLVIGLGIAGLCAWRISVNRPQDYSVQMAAARVARPAADFEALDAHNQMFRLQRYLGRHRVLVVFFSAELTAAGDPNLTAIRDAYPLLKAADVKVVGVSTALPQHNRTAMEGAGEFPFELVSDVDLGIHDRWARIDPATKQPLPGVFLIDRKGTVKCFGDTPQPVEDVPALVRELTQP